MARKDLSQIVATDQEGEQFNLQPWETLSDVQIEAARMRANGTRTADIAVRIGVNVRTLQRWDHDSAYQLLVSRLQAELLASLEPKLADLMLLAADVIAQALEGNLASDDPRVVLARQISRETSFRVLRARATVAAAAANGEDVTGVVVRRR